MQTWPRPTVPALPGRGSAVEIWDVAQQAISTPVAPGEPASLYVCGITPYDATHLGHAMTYLTFDLLQRAWLDAGSTVAYVQNITDIDDPLFERAAKLDTPWQEIADREIRRFANDATALRLLPPTAWVAVTEHMAGIVKFIERLVAAGAAYELDGDLYFDTRAGSRLGGVSHLSDAERIAVFAERGGDPQRPGKRHPLDALLWLRARPGEPAFPAPFGQGRPGWHVECLAIAHDELGERISVQGGGSDLQFPHHDYCCAEGRAVGFDYARHFMHVGMVGYQGSKMSKSLGNLVFVSELLSAGTDPMALRLALMSQHYRQDWQWSAGLLIAAEARLLRWREALACLGGADAAGLLAQVRAAMAADLNAPAALAAIDSWAERTLAGDQVDAAAQGVAARMLDALLGLAI